MPSNRQKGGTGPSEAGHRVREGTTAAIADGSFDALLRSHPWLADAFTKANLPGRCILRIANPLMTPETQGLPETLFYRP